MNEVETTHEFSKMREKLLEKEASIVKPLMRQIRKGIINTGSCIVKPRRFTLDNIKFIYESRMTSKDGIIMSSRIFYALDLEINKRVYKYVKILFDSKRISCYYFTDHYFQRTHERNSFLSEMEQFNMIRKVSDTKRMSCLLSPARASKANSANSRKAGFSEPLYLFSDDGISVVLFNEVILGPELEQSAIFITFLGKDMYNSYRSYCAKLSKLCSNVVDRIIYEYGSYNANIINTFGLLVKPFMSIWLEYDEDKQVVTQAKIANKRYHRKFLKSYLNKMAMDYVRVEWSDLDEENKAKLVSICLDTVRIPLDMFDRIIENVVSKIK